MKDGPLIEGSGLVFVSIYLLSLLAIGWLGKAASHERSLKDFYLAGHGLSLPVLFFTFYATQYSGNNLLGFAGAAYRSGFGFLVSVTFMMGIVAVYWLFAPKLLQLSRTKRYITPGDYVSDRYGSSKLVLVLNIIFIITLSAYIITNLKAIGLVVELATDGAVSFSTGIIVLAIIMVAYESLGGMRSVAWTDAIQGALLFLGGLVVVIALAYHSNGYVDLIDKLKTNRPEFWQPPTLNDQIKWISIMLLVAFGAAVYPQALQRIFAARNAKVLQRALQFLVFMPLVTTLFAVIVGLSGAAIFPELTKLESESVALRVLSHLELVYPSLGFLFVIFIAAVIAAIMSTVDSALLTISSIITQDIYRPMRPDANQKSLTNVGKLFSWLLMAGLVVLAIDLPQTIWKLTQLKLELLIQAAPAILLGIRANRPSAKALLIGIGVGVVITIGLKYGQDIGFDWQTKPFGIHAGLWGAICNLLVVVAIHRTYLNRI